MSVRRRELLRVLAGWLLAVGLTGCGSSSPAGASFAHDSPAPSRVAAAAPASAHRGDVRGFDPTGVDTNDVAALRVLESRLAESGHSFVASRRPIEQALAAETRAAGADLEVTYIGLDRPLQVIALVLRDPATARGMAPLLARKPMPSSTWVVATWGGRGLLLLVADTGQDDSAGAEAVRAVVAALSRG